MALYIADVSEFQGSIDWAAYGSANSGAIVRLHNSSRADRYAAANIAGARAHCAWRGWYQYLTAGADPVKAAHDMQATLGPTLPGEVMILDLEEGSGDQHSRRAAWLNALQDPVEWTYTGLSFARTHLAGTRIEWLAAYRQGEPGDAHQLWQFTNARRFAGIAAPCDASVYNGPLSQLQALSKTPSSTPPPTKPPAPPAKPPAPPTKPPAPPPPTPAPAQPDPFQEDTMDRLIIALYRRYIGRTPSDAEVDGWLVNAAQRGWAAKDIAARIQGSSEAQAHTVKP